MNINDIFEIFQTALAKKASDIHIIHDYPVTLRIEGELFPLIKYGVITPEMTKKLLYSLLNERQIELFETNRELDFSYEWDTHRLRVNYYFTASQPAAAFRLIPNEIKTLEQLNLPKFFENFTQYNDGLILMTGPTGEGKSTTIASVLNLINITSKKHIITIEDPVEFVYPKGKSIVSQRELNSDTYSWVKSLRASLREDPDVVLIGEMRDLETIRTVMTVAETGHLVFSSLHTNNTSQAINRIVDIFPGNQQTQIRQQLSGVLRAIVSQRLVPKSDGAGRIPAVEVLINNAAVSTLIRENKTHMIDSVLETNEDENMVLFEKSLAQLYNAGEITRETAYGMSLRKSAVKKFIL